MVPCAPRYDPAIDRLVRELDDPAESMAETCRRVGDRAQALGFVRPSLVHLRTLVRAERDRRELEAARRQAVRELADHVVHKVLAGQAPHPHRLADQIEEIQRLGRLAR